MRPLRIVAFDLSLTGTGIAATHDSLGEPRLACRTVAPRKYPSTTRMDHRRAHETIAAVIVAVQCRPDLILIEEPLLVSGTGDIAVRLGELHGAIKHWLWSQKHTYVDVHPSHVKQYATGNGGAKKEAVLAAIRARYGRLVHVGTDDEADALSMLTMAKEAYGQPLVDADGSRIVAPPSASKPIHARKWPDLAVGG